MFYGSCQGIGHKISCMTLVSFHTLTICLYLFVAC